MFLLRFGSDYLKKEFLEPSILGEVSEHSTIYSYLFGGGLF